MSLSDFRAIEVAIDFANDWIAPVRLNAGDIDGRTIRVSVTDGGKPVTGSDAQGWSARLLFNANPDDTTSSGGYATMTQVTDNVTTLTFETPVPRAALQSTTETMGIQLSRTENGETKVVASRNFSVTVEPSVLRAEAPDMQDPLKELIEGIAKIETATDEAGTAADRANLAAGKAEGFDLTVDSTTTGAPGTEASVTLTQKPAGSLHYHAAFTIPAATDTVAGGISIGVEEPSFKYDGCVWLVEAPKARTPLWPSSETFAATDTWPEREGLEPTGSHVITAIRRWDAGGEAGQWTDFTLADSLINA